MDRAVSRLIRNNIIRGRHGRRRSFARLPRTRRIRAARARGGNRATGTGAGDLRSQRPGTGHAGILQERGNRGTLPPSRHRPTSTAPSSLSERGANRMPVGDGVRHGGTGAGSGCGNASGQGRRAMTRAPRCATRYQSVVRPGESGLESSRVSFCPLERHNPGRGADRISSTFTPAASNLRPTDDQGRPARS